MSKREPVSIDDLTARLPASMKENKEPPKAELYKFEGTAEKEKNTESVLFRCSKEFKEMLKIRAEEEHLDVSAYIRRVIYQDIESSNR